MSHSHEASFDPPLCLRRTAWGLWGGVGFVAGVFLLRGLSGAFSQELSPLAACLGTTLAAGVSLAAFWCDRFSAKEDQGAAPFWQLSLLTILPPTLLGFILVPASSRLGIAWVTILGVGLTVTLHLLKQPPGGNALASTPDAEVAHSIPVLSTPDVSQWMTRRRITEAGETWDQIEGQITVEFAAGQQHATAHLAMCPPMPSTPEIECEVRDESELEWKIAAVHPYGVRLEVRRSLPATEPARVPLGYTMAALQESPAAKAA